MATIEPKHHQLVLPDRYLKMVNDTLKTTLPGLEVWAYGSRVNGSCYEASDLDLVVHGQIGVQIPYGQLDAAKDAFVEGNLPIIVQLVDWSSISETFRREIEAGYVVIQR